MTPNKIRELIDKEADARFGETIERLLIIVRNRHTHQCGYDECRCEYCQFINVDYVSTKLRLHRLKRNLRHYDNGDYHKIESGLDLQIAGASNSHQFYWYLNYSIEALKRNLKKLKCHKKDLQTNII